MIDQQPTTKQVPQQTRTAPTAEQLAQQLITLQRHKGHGCVNDSAEARRELLKQLKSMGVRIKFDGKFGGGKNL